MAERDVFVLRTLMCDTDSDGNAQSNWNAETVILGNASHRLT